jgi:hypothetical protein
LGGNAKAARTKKLAPQTYQLIFPIERNPGALSARSSERGVYATTTAGIGFGARCNSKLFFQGVHMLKIHPVRLVVGVIVAALLAAVIYASPMPELGAKAALACAVFFVGGALAFIASV